MLLILHLFLLHQFKKTLTTVNKFQALASDYFLNDISFVRFLFAGEVELEEAANTESGIMQHSTNCNRYEKKSVKGKATELT